MTIETEVAALTTATTSLLNAVNVSKAVLDSKVEEAIIKAASATESAAAALGSKGAAAGSAASALAIYGNTAAMQAALDSAKNQVSLAAGYAASASSVVQQDLSGINAAALHRSPGTIVAQCIYDTSLDSDGGAWVDRMGHTSWMNEPLNGAWRGQVASEAAARAISGAATGDYFQLTTNGKFYKLNAGSGTTEVFRGNKAKFPRLSAIVAEADSVTIYDLTEAGRPMFCRVVAVSASDPYAQLWRNSASYPATSVGALNGVVLVGLGGSSSVPEGGVLVLNFAADRLARYSAEGAATPSRAWGEFPNGVSMRNTPLLGAPTALPAIAHGVVNAVAMTALPDAPIDLATGTAVPTIAAFTAGGISVIQDTAKVVNSTSTTAFTAGSIDANEVMGVNSTGALVSGKPRSLVAGFAMTSYLPTISPALMGVPAVMSGSKAVKGFGNASGVTLLKENMSTPTNGSSAQVTSTFNTGHMFADTRRAYLANTEVESVSNPATVPDRSYKSAAASIYGTLTKSAVATAAQLVAYSGFSAVNYLQEPYSADLDFGIGEWSVGAWVSYSAAAVSRIVHRGAAAGPSITLGTDVAGKLVATAYDGTTTRTVTTATAYNKGAWLKARATYVAGKLAITVNGVEVASTVGAPLLTLNNSNAVLTIGNSRALDAPFPGSIALLKIGATVPTPEQALWMYEQEKQMFRDGAQVTLPSSAAVTDMAYDQSRDRWVAIQSGHESSFTGLVRTAVNTPSAGSFAKVAATSGVKLLARTTTSPGVDVTIPAYGLREELVKRGETAAKAAKTLTSFDFDAASFTATTTNASNQLTAVASVVGTPYLGMGISGTGIPAGTTITGINGTTYTLSANATAAGTAVTMGQTDFTLPVGYVAKDVLSAGARKREGTTKDWVRLFDGFRETVRFAVSPGSAAWVQINAAKE